MKLGKNSIALKKSSNEYFLRDRVRSNTLGDYFRKMELVEDYGSFRECKLRDLLMVGLNGYVKTYGNDFVGKVKYDCVKIDGEEMYLRENVGNIKYLSYVHNGGKIEYNEEPKNVVLYGKKKIYVFDSPYRFYEFDRDEDTTILCKDSNSAFEGLGAPASPFDDRFQKPLVLAHLDGARYRHGWKDSDLNISISDEGKIQISTLRDDYSKIKVDAENALAILKYTKTDVNDFDDNEKKIYDEIVKRNNSDKMNFAEIKDVISDRKKDDINKIVDEISEGMKDKSNDNEKNIDD